MTERQREAERDRERERGKQRKTGFKGVTRRTEDTEGLGEKVTEGPGGRWEIGGREQGGQMKREQDR